MARKASNRKERASQIAKELQRALNLDALTVYAPRRSPLLYFRLEGPVNISVPISKRVLALGEYDLIKQTVIEVWMYALRTAMAEEETRLAHAS